jgi:hypothetical protein
MLQKYRMLFHSFVSNYCPTLNLSKAMLNKIKIETCLIKLRGYINLVHFQSFRITYYNENI